MSDMDLKLRLTADNDASPAVRALLADVRRLKRELASAFSPAASNAFASKITADAARMRAAFAGLNQVQRQFAAGFTTGASASGQAFATMRRQARRYAVDRARVERSLSSFRIGATEAHDRVERQAHRTRLSEMRQRGRLDAQLHGAAMARARQLGRFSGRLASRSPGTMFPAPVATVAAAGTAAWATRNVLQREAGTDAAEIDARTYTGLGTAQARKLREAWAMPAAVDFGATAEDMLRSFTDAIKAGIPEKGAKDFTNLSVQAGEAWGKPLQETTDFLANVNTILGGFGEKFDARKLRSVSNTLTFLAKEMSTSPDKLMSFAERGAGAAMALGMTQEAGLAFGAASTSAGNQAGASGRMFDALAGFFNVRLQALTKRSAEGDDAELAKAMLRDLGYGSYDGMQRQRRANPDAFMFDFVDRFNARIKDGKKRAAYTELATGQEWFGEFGRLLDNPSILKEARKALRASKGADSLTDVWKLHVQKLAFVWKQVKAGFDNILGEVGMLLSPIAAKVGAAFVQWTRTLTGPNGIRRHVQRFVDGLTQGFFGGDMDAVLKRLSTAGGVDPEAVFRFAKGFAEGLREVWEVFKQIGQGIAKVIGVDAGTAEGAGKLIGSILSLSAALVFLRPVVSVLDTLASGVTGLAAALGAVSGLGLGSAAAGGGGALALAPWVAAGAGIFGGALLMKSQGEKLKGKPVKPNTPADYLLRWRRHNILEREMNAADRRKDDAIPTMSLYDRQQTAKRGMNPYRVNRELPRFAHGGRFTVGGAGGTDSQLVRFWASPGETVSIHTPDQVNGGGGLMVNLRTTGVEDRLGAMVNALYRLGDDQREFAAKVQAAAMATGSVAASSFAGAAVDGAGIVPNLPGGGGRTLGKTPYGPGFYYPDVAPGARQGSDDAAGPNGEAVVAAGAGWTTVRRADGSVVKRTGARNWRNNNPGNIEYGAFAKNAGAIGADGRFAVFPSYEAGRKAKEKLLFEGKSYVGKTLAQAITRYAPPSENNTAGYIAQVARAAGVGGDTPISSLSPDQRRKMLDAMERVEGFKVGRETVIQPGTGGAPSAPADAAAAGAKAALSMTNQGATRNRRITPFLSDRIREAIGAVYGSGYRAEVYSGGQNPLGVGGKRTGSTRHDDHGEGGMAADLYVIGPDGKRIRGADLAKLGQYWRAKKFGGVGLEMRGGGIHLDQHKDRAGHWWYGDASKRVGQGRIAAGERGILPELARPSAGALANSVKPTPESIIQNVPMPTPRPGASATGGQMVQAPSVTFNNYGANQTPEQIADAVQRRVTQAWGWRTHDVEHDLT